MTKYLSMCQTFAQKVDFNANSPVGSPDGSPFDAAKLQAVIAGAAPSMTKSYANDYAGNRSHPPVRRRSAPGSLDVARRFAQQR